MPKLLNDYIRPVTPPQIRGEVTYLPDTIEYDSIFPGMATLSYREVQDISTRLFQDYITTNRMGGLPNVHLIIENLSWVIFAYAYEAEAIVRENHGEFFEAEVLREAVRAILEAEDVMIDAVTDVRHLLSTTDVILSVQQDILNMINQNRLTASYHDEDGGVRYVDVPKKGFTILM